MAVYAVGDIQGCHDELEQLLTSLHFDQADDQLWLVGDLVNRGPNSLQTLRLVKNLGDSAICVLGNHDLHLLALALAPGASVDDRDLRDVLDAPDRDELIDWLRRLPLAHYDNDLATLMVHAGVLPAWSLEKILSCASEVEAILRGDHPESFLAEMYGKKPNQWSDSLSGNDRLRFITNCLTRIRFCTANGTLDFDQKIDPTAATGGLLPWFTIPQRKTADIKIVFGHWSTLGLMQGPGLLALDTGCVWGGSLTAAQLDAADALTEIPSRQPAQF